MFLTMKIQHFQGLVCCKKSLNAKLSSCAAQVPCLMILEVSILQMKLFLKAFPIHWSWSKCKTKATSFNHPSVDTLRLNAHAT